MQTRILTVLAAALALLPMTSDAGTSYFAFNDSGATVHRPASGSVTVNLTGTLFVDPADGDVGETVLLCPYMNQSDPFGPHLDCYGGFSPNSDGTWEGVVSVIVPSTAPLGFYGYALNVWWDYPALGAFLSNHDGGPYVLDFFFIDVVGTPEPGTLAMLGLGLVGLGLSRRRTSN